MMARIETEDLGFIDYWEFAPQGDTFIVFTKPDKTKTETEGGLILTTKTDVIMDRPFKGVVVTVGPDAPYNVGDYLYWQPQSGMDLAMVRTQAPEEKYLLLHPDAILGQRVKDTRTTNTNTNKG